MGFDTTAPTERPLKWALKTAVVAIATTNVTLSTLNNGDTVGGKVVSTGDRVLLTGQTTGAQNGIYTVPASEGSPSRVTDADATAEFASPLAVDCTGGTHAGERWYLTNPGLTLDTDTPTFANQSSAAERLSQCAPATIQAPTAISV